MPLSKPQETIAKDPKRFKVVIAGRRFGKTHLAIRNLCYHAKEPHKEVWYVSPSYKMAKNIVWRKLKNKLIDLRWAKKVNETELKIELKNGSVIALKGADNADSLRGVGLDYLIMDEFADIDPTAWYEVLRPTLADKEGHAMFIGTPKGISNWSYDLYQAVLENPEEWSRYQFTTIEGGNVSAKEIESAKKDLDERSFRQEFLATFENYAGRIYYAFDREHNVKQTDYNTSVIHVGCDFNISPMSSCIAVQSGSSIHLIDEIRIFSSNTDELADEIKTRYPNSKIIVYPDPASRQRKTSAGGRTDLSILQNAGFIVKCPNAHTPVRDRINAVNSKLKASDGTIGLTMDPKCKYTIEGLERQTYKPDTTQPDKTSGYDHQMDALGYLIDYLFPIKKQIEVTQPRTFGHQLAR